jgi:hypothetical protein
LGAATTLTSTGAGAITFGGTLNGAHTLAVNTSGVTTFAGAVGGTTALTSLTTDAGGSVVINGGLIKTTAAQTFNDPLSVGADTILQGVNVAMLNTVNGAYGLTVNDSGTTVFAGGVGGVTPLTNLTTDSPGAVQINAASVTTSIAVMIAAPSWRFGYRRMLSPSPERPAQGPCRHCERPQPAGR